MTIDFREFPAEIINLKERLEASTSSHLEIRSGQMSIGANETMLNRMENGKPVIIVKEGIKPTEHALFHELSELDIRASNGIHAWSIEGPLLEHVKKTATNAMVVLSKCHSIFYHSYFYPRMLEFGYHPTSYIEEQLNSAGSSYPHKSYHDTDTSLHVVLDLWHLSLGFPDEESRAQDLFDMLHEEFPEEGQIAQLLSQKSNDFVSPELETEVFPQILAAVFGYGNTISRVIDGHTAVYS